MEFGFDEGGDFFASAGLLQGESAVLAATGGVGVQFGLVRLYSGFYAVYRGGEIGFGEFAFPDGDDVPGDGFEALDVERVAFTVAGHFLFPEICVGFWDGVFGAASVAVPEAAVDEYGGAVFRQDDVGGAGKCADIEPVAVAPAPQPAPYRLFGTGVLRADVRHTLVPLQGCQRVGHRGIVAKLIILIRSGVGVSNPLYALFCRLLLLFSKD